jgi:hypothetical protein
MTFPCNFDRLSVERWQRLALGIRLACHPGQPAVIRQYLGLGHRLVQLGHLEPTGAWPNPCRHGGTDGGEGSGR